MGKNVLCKRAVTLGIVLFAIWSMAPVPATAQAQPGAGIGGGTNVTAGGTVPVTWGTEIERTIHLSAFNPGPGEMEVEFKSFAPEPVEIVPEWRTATVPPREKMLNRVSVRVGEATPVGDHQVRMQIIRTDVPETDASVRTLPAFGTSFVLRNSGEVGKLQVRAVSRADGQPVVGDIRVSAVLPRGRAFPVMRSTADSVRTDLAPSRYKVEFLMGDQVRASEEVEVTAGRTSRVLLRVDTVSFLLVNAKPVREGGKVVVAELLASVRNQYQELPGPAYLRVHVDREGEFLETVDMKEIDPLRLGLTEGKATYRPEAGWEPGEYTFRFELRTADFLITAGEEPSIVIGAGPHWHRIALMAAALLVLLVAFWIRRRTRRGDPGYGARTRTLASVR